MIPRPAACDEDHDNIEDSNRTQPKDTLGKTIVGFMAHAHMPGSSSGPNQVSIQYVFSYDDDHHLDMDAAIADRGEYLHKHLIWEMCTHLSPS
nr:hypothetical protein CFP56_42228 [Quercus suber]